MSYEHLFFDWDHTLWDFETNSKQALEKIFYEYDLRKFGVLSPQHFIDTYMPINYTMWKEFREGKMDAATVKIKRFQDTFQKFGVVDMVLVNDVKSFYLDKLPLGGALMPNVLKTIKILNENFELHVVTNGFLEVTQHKLAHSNLASFFRTVLSAEEVGVLKPNTKVFQEALKRSGASAERSLFIGDNLIADVQGARNAGMHQVFFNPLGHAHEESPTYEINDFQELLDILGVGKMV